ncbi:MAG: DUF3987 domain-containing protein [Planctomycetota bacterium]|nr:MAG: DUF3987 domain-containing protein [Planctomycetota bacterium]
MARAAILMIDLKNQLLNAAIHYAELEYPVFPCAPGGKVPITKHGFKDATTDIEQIETWWRQRPDANIGITTTGLVVIDVDGADNPWLAGDPDMCADLAQGALSFTPGGGRHHIFRQPESKNWGNTSGKLAPKIDTRGNGGYIIVPPSVIDDKAYTWAETYELDESPEQLPEPPAWLAELLDNGPHLCSQRPRDAPTVAPCSPQGEDSAATGNIIPSGQRNATLARLAGAMRRVGMGYAEIRAALAQTNADRCKPPMSMREVDKISASICRYEPDQVSVAVAENHWAQDFQGGEKEEELTPSLPDPGPLPEELLRVPGFVSEVMDYCLETAPYPNTVMAFCGALALQAFLAGRKVRDPGDNRTNVYLLGLGHSGTGKDWPRKINTKIIHGIGLSDSLGERFASGEGIQDALFGKPCMLFQTDEIDGMLQTINKAKDARHENIMSTLLTMFSASNSVFPMRRKAGKESPGAIDQPCLIIFGTAIPNHYYEALSERMLTNGFFARMIILESNKRPEGQDPKLIELPDRVLETAKWWSEFNPGTGNLEKWHPVPKVVEHTDEAVEILTECRREAETEYSAAEARNDSVGTTVWSRVNEQARKLALLYAVSENHIEPVIGKGATEWGSLFAVHQTKRMLFMAGEHVFESEFDSRCKKLLAILKKWRAKKGNQWMEFWRIRRKLKWNDRDHEEVRNALIGQRIIEYDEPPTGGKPKKLYRLVESY